MIIIELSTAEKCPQYARKPFFRAPGLPNPPVSATYHKDKAKQFKTVKQAHAWLARRGFEGLSGYRSIRVSEKYPEPFTGFELLSLDTTED